MKKKQKECEKFINMAIAATTRRGKRLQKELTARWKLSSMGSAARTFN